MDVALPVVPTKGQAQDAGSVADAAALARIR